jgi:hypothetical protein
MNINRHNYEELFLMYVDNELSDAQRAEVEAFVQQNPDLTEELALLMDAVLVPVDFTFEGKEILFKDERSININNYEEYFLLDVDNELNAAEKNEVEKFVLQHPKLQDEFTLLHQTKLEGEVVEFKGKETLYRTEKKERRVIAMSFTRFAVAASVIGLIATLWIVYPDNKSGVETFASTEKPAISQPEKEGKQQPTLATNNEDAVTPVVIDENFIASKKNTTSLVKPLKGDSKNQSDNKIQVKVVEESPNELLASLTPKQQNIEPVGRPVENTNTIETGLATQASNTNENASLIQPAFYKEANMDDDDEEKSFYIGSVEINKNKLRGLFKKASNLFDKKARTGEDRTLQIASFEIKTK